MGAFYTILLRERERDLEKRGKARKQILEVVWVQISRRDTVHTKSQARIYNFRSLGEEKQTRD